MRYFSFILVSILLIGCKIKSEEININENSINLAEIQDYTTFLKRIDQIVCNTSSGLIKLCHQDSDTILFNSRNSCSEKKYISCESNLMSVYDKELDDVILNINRDEKVVVEMIRDYIVNPLRLANKSETERKAGFRLILDKGTPVDKLYENISKLKLCYHLAREGTEAPAVLLLEFDNFWIRPLPPPQPTAK